MRKNAREAVYKLLFSNLFNDKFDESFKNFIYDEEKLTEEIIKETEGEEIKLEETELEEVEILYTFRYRNNLDSHYEKHGIEMGFDSPEEYLAAANKALANPDILHKIEAEDGDDVYYLEATNEFIVVSTDGYIRTYYYPTDGIDYFNRQ